MKKTALLLIAILIVSTLSSTQEVSAEPSRESHSIGVLRMIYVNFYAFGGNFHVLYVPFDRVLVDDAVYDGDVCGDADDLAGGKTDRIGDGSLDTDCRAVLIESGDSPKSKLL